MASDPPLKDFTEAIHQGDQDRYDYKQHDRRAPEPWGVAEVGDGEPLPELIQPRTIAEVIEQKGAYQRQATILNKEIQNVRQGQPSKIVYKSLNRMPQVRGRIWREGYIVDPAFMETLTSARQAWDLQSGDGIEGREFYNEAIPSLGSLGALMPPSRRNDNWHFNMGDGQGLDWHIKNRQWSKDPEKPTIYPELLDPVDFNKVKFPSYNLQRGRDVNAPPEHWLNAVGPQGNKPQGMDQLGDSQLIDMMRNRKPDYFNRWNESRRKPGRRGPATEPIMPETISPEQWADIADKYGGSWFGQPMYGPEGTGNIMAQHLRDQMMIK